MHDAIEISIQQGQSKINQDILQKILEIKALFMGADFEDLENIERVKKLLEAKIAIQQLNMVLEVININNISAANADLILQTRELFENIWEININSFSDPQLLQYIASNSIEVLIGGQLIITSDIYTELTGIEVPPIGDFDGVVNNLGV